MEKQKRFTVAMVIIGIAAVAFVVGMILLPELRWATGGWRSLI